MDTVIISSSLQHTLAIVKLGPWLAFYRPLSNGSVGKMLSLNIGHHGHSNTIQLVDFSSQKLQS